MARHVPISEFKDHASELVAAAQGGEDILITRHGKPAARLTAPPLTGAERRQRAEAALRRMSEIRAEQRARGVTTTVEEMIVWKNEGQR